MSVTASCAIWNSQPSKACRSIWSCIRRRTLIFAHYATRYLKPKMLCSGMPTRTNLTFSLWRMRCDRTYYKTDLSKLRGKGRILRYPEIDCLLQWMRSCINLHSAARCSMQRLRFLQATVQPLHNSIAVTEPVPIHPQSVRIYISSIRKLPFAADRVVRTNVVFYYCVFHHCVP